MVKIDKFEIERWLSAHSLSAKYSIADSYPEALSIKQLQELSDDNHESNTSTSSEGPISSALLSKALSYGEPAGSRNLRSTISGLYSIKVPTPLPAENVVITSGGSIANCLCFYALCGPGDHVIVQYPTYQLSHSVPSSLGTEVSLWKAKEQDKWRFDVEELRRLIKSNTKMIVLTNPQNPTGAIIPRSTLEDIIEISREHSLYVLSDEVYRPLFHSISPADEEFPPSVLSLGYERGIVTGSMSKAYSLPGIRVGWIACRNIEFIDKILTHRSYTTISVSLLDQEVAAYALSQNCIHNLLKRNIAITKRNLEVLESWIDNHRWACEWVRPVASTVAFVKFIKRGKPIDDVAFCDRLLKKKSVLLAPGSLCFGRSEDYAGYVRVGYGSRLETLQAGLNALSEFLEEDLESIPLAAQALPLR